MLLLFFSFLPILSSQPILSPDDPLVLVQVVIRHADRAPTSHFTSKESEKIFFRGLGHISDEGIENAYKQGEQFKKKYVDSGFVDKRLIPGQVLIRSSPVPRVLSSASSFGAGLFEKTEGGMARIPAVTTVDHEDDMLTVPQIMCSDGMDELGKKFGFKGLPSHEQILNAATKGMPPPVDCKSVKSQQIEAIVAESANSHMKLPPNEMKCAEHEAKKYMYKYMELIAGVGSFHNTKRLQRISGFLMKTLLDNMVQMISCGSNCTSIPKLRVYYTHDITLVALAEIFNITHIFNGETPAFNSALTFELRSGRFGPYIKILMKNGVSSPFEDVDGGCKVKGCTLDYVIQSTQQYALADPQKCNGLKTSSSTFISTLSLPLILYLFKGY